MAACPESSGKQLLVLLLRGPDVVFHGLEDVVVVPGLDHEVAYTCKHRVSEGLREQSVLTEDMSCM